MTASIACLAHVPKSHVSAHHGAGHVLSQVQLLGCISAEGHPPQLQHLQLLVLHGLAGLQVTQVLGCQHGKDSTPAMSDASSLWSCCTCPRYRAAW